MAILSLICLIWHWCVTKVATGGGFGHNAVRLRTCGTVFTRKLSTREVFITSLL